MLVTSGSFQLRNQDRLVQRGIQVHISYSEVEKLRLPTFTERNNSSQPEVTQSSPTGLIWKLILQAVLVTEHSKTTLFINCTSVAMDFCVVAMLYYLILLYIFIHLLAFFFTDADFTLLWASLLGRKSGEDTRQTVANV